MLDSNIGTSPPRNCGKPPIVPRRMVAAMGDLFSSSEAPWITNEAPLRSPQRWGEAERGGHSAAAFYGLGPGGRGFAASARSVCGGCPDRPHDAAVKNATGSTSSSVATSRSAPAPIGGWLFPARVTPSVATPLAFAAGMPGTTSDEEARLRGRSELTATGQEVRVRLANSNAPA